MRAPMEMYAGLLDRSLAEIAALSSDARAIDLARIARIADIWDNNTFPLVAIAAGPRRTRAERARARLEWIADLGTERRDLLVSLDPDLDVMLPAARPEPPAYRDYRGVVSPRPFPVTAETVTSLETDYDFPSSTVRDVIVRAEGAVLAARLLLDAPRKFTPLDDSGNPGTAPSLPAPAALSVQLSDITELTFDSDDRTGAGLIADAAGVTMAVGHGCHVRAAAATVRPDDSYWHSSAAGQAADAVTPHERGSWSQPSPVPGLRPAEGAVARFLFEMMAGRIRVAGNAPYLSGRIPMRELCEGTAGAGTAILRAGARPGPARSWAFKSLWSQWKKLPSDAKAAPIPSAGPALPRYVRYATPHEGPGTVRPGRAVLAVATPAADPSAPWRLASEDIPYQTRFRLTATAFAAPSGLRRDETRLTLGDGLLIQQHP